MDKIEFIAKILLTGNVTEDNIEAYLEHALDQLSDELQDVDDEKWLDVYEVNVTKRDTGRDDG